MAATPGTVGSPASEPSPPLSPIELPRATLELAAGSLIGRYRIDGMLGRGGMGVVYRAQDTGLHRPVAIKMIGDATALVEDVHRFVREAQLAARLSHPGIVSVLEAGMHEGRPFIVMDYVEGRSLDDVLREDVVSPRRAAQLIKQVAEALDHAHKHGVVHRDVKPPNVLVGADDRTWLADFGLALDPSTTRQLTLTGEVLGTPSYLAPEQANSQHNQIGPWTDVWALGAVLYRTLVGQPPFTAKSPILIVQKVVTEDPPEPRSIVPDVPEALEAIAMRCLEKDPRRRYGSAAEVAGELGRFLEQATVPAQPPASRREPRRAPRKVSLPTVAIVLASSVALGAVGVSRLLDHLGVTKRREQTRRRADLAAEQLAKLRTGAATSSVTTDALIAAAIGAVTAADGHLAAANDDSDARRRAIDARVALAQIAAEARLWDVAKVAYSEAIELGFEDRGVLDDIDVRRGKASSDVSTAPFGEKKERIDALLARAGSGALHQSGAFEKTLLDLVRDADAETVTIIAAELDRVTNDIHGAIQAFYGELIDAAPTDAPPRVRLETLPEAVAWYYSTASRRQAPASTIATGHLRVLIPANERFRTRKRARGSLPTRKETVATALGEDGTLRLRLCCEALGLIGIPDAALGALERYLFTETDEARGIPAGVSLIQIGTPEALELLEEVRGRFTASSQFSKTTLERRRDARIDLPPDVATRLFELWEQYTTQALSETRYVRAIANAEEMLRLNPTSAIAYAYRARARGMLGDRVAAVDDLNRAAGFADDNGRFLAALSNAKRSLGDTAGADAALDRAIELRPDDVVLLMTRAQHSREARRHAQSFTDYNRVIQIEPANARAIAQRARLRMETGNAAGAITDAENAIRLDPDNVLALHVRGVTRLRAGQLEAAIRDLDEAVARSPRDAQLLGNRARARAVANDFVGALADFDLALELRPDSVQIRQLRSMARLDAGDRIGARADAQHLLSISAKDTPAAAWARTFLEKLDAKD